MIGQTSSDQETKEVIRIIGSFIVALSGLILFSDKVLTIQLENNYGFSKTSTFIWILSQSLSPFLLALSILFKPYKTAFVIPIYFYSIQLYWVFNPKIQLDNYLLQTYAIGVSIGFLLLGIMINKINKLKNKRELENELFKKEAKEVIQLLRNQKISKKAI